MKIYSLDLIIVQALCESSLQARLRSYSPYSKFKVGAALQCGDHVVSGGSQCVSPHHIRTKVELQDATLKTPRMV